MNPDKILREQLLYLLRGGGAHMSFEQAVADFAPEHYNTRPPNIPYTPWALLEHLRIAQSDILEFVRDPHYVSPPWPQGYWPDPDEQADQARWERSVRAFQADHKALEALVGDPAVSLTTPLEHAPTYTILREMLLVADHNAYHIGEFAILRQVMGTWPANHR